MMDRARPGPRGEHGLFQTLQVDDLTVVDRLNERQWNTDGYATHFRHRPLPLSDGDIKNIVSYRVREYNREQLYRRLTKWNNRGLVVWLRIAQVKPERTGVLELQSMLRDAGD